MYVHASAVSCHGCGVLIMGRSGSGKSSLAADLIVSGARLIADDQVMLESRDEGIFASCPVNLNGLIELRGIGIIRLETSATHQIHLVVDLDASTPKRTPEPEYIEILDHSLIKLAAKGLENLASKVMLTTRALALHGSSSWRL